MDLNRCLFLVIFAPRCVFESCFSKMCRHKGFECVRAGFCSASLVSQHSKMCSNQCRFIQKQGWGKYYQEATWNQLGAPNVTILIHFGGILASDSTKKSQKGRSRKTCFLGASQSARPGSYDYLRAITRCQGTPARWSFLRRKAKGVKTTNTTFRTRL